MIPGEVITQPGEIELNQGRSTVVGWQTQVIARFRLASFSLYEVNGFEFDRERSRGMRPDIPAGTAVRFEPGDEREVKLVPPVAVRFTASIAESMAA